MREQIAFHNDASSSSSSSSSGGDDDGCAAVFTILPQQHRSNPNDVATISPRTRSKDDSGEMLTTGVSRVPADSVGQLAVGKMRPIYRMALEGLAAALGEQKGKEKKKKLYRLR